MTQSMLSLMRTYQSAFLVREPSCLYQDKRSASPGADGLLGRTGRSDRMHDLLVEQVHLGLDCEIRET